MGVRPHDYNRNPESVFVIIFEYDGWPAKKRLGRIPQPITSILSGNYVSYGDNNDDSGFSNSYTKYITYRTNNPIYGLYVVFNLAHVGFNEVNAGYYNISDTDEVIDTPPFGRSGMPYIMHKTVLH